MMKVYNLLYNRPRFQIFSLFLQSKKIRSYIVGFIVGHVYTRQMTKFQIFKIKISDDLIHIYDFLHMFIKFRGLCSYFLAVETTK